MSAGPTVAPVGSFNNEIGVPLTVLRVDRGHPLPRRRDGRARHRPHPLPVDIAPPHVGVVLNVGIAHVGEFGTRAIAQAKAELVEALPADGPAVLNADDPLVAAMASRTRARVVTFGSSPDADVRADDVTLDAHGRARSPWSARRVAGSPSGSTGPPRLQRAGRGRRGLEWGWTPRRRGRAVAAEAASRWRMEVTDRPDGVTVVNDAYNANPDSMRAALDALRAMHGSGRAAPGPSSARCASSATVAGRARRVGNWSAALGVDRLVVVGAGAGPSRRRRSCRARAPRCAGSLTPTQPTSCCRRELRRR